MRELQSYLLALSYTDARIPPVAVTGIYNDDTRRALMAFQSTQNLPETGEVDHAVWEALTDAYRAAEARFRPGAAPVPLYNAALAASPQAFSSIPGIWFILQVMLWVLSETNPASFLPVEITGTPDDASAAALRAVQRLSGLAATGAPDAETWNAVVSLYNLEMAKLQSSPPIKAPQEVLFQ